VFKELDAPPLTNEFPLEESPVLALEPPSPEVNLEPDELPEDDPDVNLEPDVIPEEEDNPDVNLEPDELPEEDDPDVNLVPDALPEVEDNPDVNLEPDVLPEEEDDPRLELKELPALFKLVERADPVLREDAKLAPEEKHPAHNGPSPLFWTRGPPKLAELVVTTATVFP